MQGNDCRSRQFLAILILTVLLLGVAARGQSQPPADGLGELEKIAKAYKIEVVAVDPVFPVRTTHGLIEGKKVTGPELQKYSTLFAREFALYPPGLLQRSQLKRVVLCTDLSFAGQRRNAIPDFEHDTLYLEASRGAYNKTYMRKVVHHEFFHIIDYRDDGSVYQDDRWAALNPENFKYGNGGQAAQDVHTTSLLTKKFPGFLNHYSTTGIEEDKAEMFANLIVDLDYVEDRARTDKVIEAKAERMKVLLSGFCPEMNDEFWKRVRQTKRVDK